MRRLAVLVTFLAFPAVFAPPASAQPITLQDGFAPLVSKVAPAVVNIMTDSGSVGSGVIISSDGLVVTNHHVVAGARRVAVALGEKRVLEATRLGHDRANDLALLRLPPGTYPTLPWADSAKVRVGEFAIAIGNPLGLGTSVSVGIVSAVGRGSREPEHYEDFIQTDAAVNKGNSGGALVNTRGELIGINSRIANPWGDSNLGIAFAISSNLTRGVVEQLVKKGVTQRGWLGLSVRPTIDGYVAIIGVTRRGPAHRAGLRPLDILLQVGGKPVRSIEEFLLLVHQGTPGARVPVTVLRNGEQVTVAATLGAQPDAD